MSEPQKTGDEAAYLALFAFRLGQAHTALASAWVALEVAGDAKAADHAKAHLDDIDRFLIDVEPYERSPTVGIRP